MVPLWWRVQLIANPAQIICACLMRLLVASGNLKPLAQQKDQLLIDLFLTAMP